MELNKIYQGDVLEVLQGWPDEFVDCVVTSPPYWGLRDYGADGQIGLEKTPEEYTEKMRQVFNECKRVLKKDGTLWLNLGDTYSAERWTNKVGTSLNSQGKNKEWSSLKVERNSRLPDKNLVGIPWRVAFALQKDGWYLRQDIIWAKPNPMPESVTDRCTKSHEYIFLMSKNKDYYFDNEAIREPMRGDALGRMKRSSNHNGNRGFPSGPQNHIKKYFNKNDKEAEQIFNQGRNKRSVWTVTTKPYAEAHFATFPPDLIIPCIKTTKPDATILDPFMGSGTTAFVARSLGRKYLGIELNPEYIKMAERRLAQKLLF